MNVIIIILLLISVFLLFIFVFKMLNLSNIGNIYILENILNEINKTTLDPKFKKFIENMILIQKISGE